MTELEQLKEIEKWWSPSEAARKLETSGQWVTHLAREGKIRGVKTSLGWLLDPEDVKAMAQERKKKKTQERKRKGRQLQLT